MEQFKSLSNIGEWLSTKPNRWSQVLATRAALRVLPFAPFMKANESSHEYTLVAFRAASAMWTSSNQSKTAFIEAASPIFKRVKSISESELIESGLTGALLQTSGASARFGHNAGALIALELARLFSDAALDRTVENRNWSGLDEMVVPFGLAAKAATKDCEKLSLMSGAINSESVLSTAPLWEGREPSWFKQVWSNAKKQLLEDSHSWSVWIDWYERRIRGENFSFSIPGDRYRREENEVLRSLALSIDNSFWDRGAEHVNTELTCWLEEARERAAQNNPEDTGREGDTPTPIPAQSRAALRFGSDEEGKIVLAPSFGNQELRNDDDARDRHQLALEDAKALMQACAGSNSADRLTAMLTAYIAAAGDRIETMRPSVFVQKGERLRQESTRYESPGNFLPPLPDGIELDLKSLVKAHNMVVGLDPHLLDIDTAQTGPDDVIGDVTKPEMQGFAHEAREEEILREEAADDLVEAVDLTPDGADASDRRFRWSASSCKNLVIEAFAVALNNPIKTTAVVAGSYAIGPIPLVGNALACAIFLVSRRKWIEEKLGRHAPTWKALFSDLCDKWDGMLDKSDE